MTSTRETELGDCRFYEQKFPEPEELVMVKVNRIAEMGVYVSLLEYDNLEGMIQLSELSKRRFRSVNKLIRVGRHEVVMVIRVDKEKGYIDLSKKRVCLEDIQKCEDRFSKAKKVHQTARHIAQKHDMSVEEANQKVVWPLYKKYGHALDGLKDAALDPEEVLGGLQLPADIKETLIADIKLRLSPTAIRLSARIDTWCFGFDGIDAVKKALDAGKVADDAEVQIKIKLIAPPQYAVIASCYDKVVGTQVLEACMKRIEESIKSFTGGDFKQQGDVIISGGEDDKRLQELLEKEESDDEESDSDEEDEDEGMGMVEEDAPEDQVDDDDKSDDEAETKN